MWTELLEYADRFPVVSRDPVGKHNIIMALHYTGRLGSDVFSYSNFKGSMFISAAGNGDRRGYRGYRRGMLWIRLCLRLGMVNAAEKEGYEILEDAGKCPELLWELAKINIAKRWFFSNYCRGDINFIFIN